MKITFLLLVATGRDIYLATSLLLPSIYKYFKLDNLHEIVIVIKNKDRDLLIKRLFEMKQNNINLPLRIINESEIFFESSDFKNTYYLQMYLKLLSSNIITTDKYFTLDADILFINNFSNNDLFDNKIYYNKNKSDKWIKRSSEFLNFDEPDFSVNQTPFTFKTELVKKMLNEIDVKKFILENQCSEYTLYQIFLQKNNIFYLNYEEKPSYRYNLKYPQQHMTDQQINKLVKIVKNQGKKLCIIQSRINVHHRLVNTINEIIPQSFYKKPKIAILTVVSGKLYENRYKEAFEIKKKYCKYHNYDFIFEYINEKKYKYKNGWIKIYKLLEKLKDYDYIFASDADVVITNRNIQIEDIIFRYMSENHSCLITTDYNSLNSGNIIWKNCNETFKILRTMLNIGNNTIRYGLNKPFKAKGIYEQPNLIHLYNKFKDIQNVIKIIPQFEMNSYTKIFPSLKKPNILKSIDDIFNRCNWQRGDFLVHFAGMNYINNDKFKINIQNIINQFVHMYYTSFIYKEGHDYKFIK